MNRVKHQRLLELLQLRFGSDDVSAVAERALAELGLEPAPDYEPESLERIAAWLLRHRGGTAGVAQLLRVESAQVRR
ncbi:MAG: hypothetical protein JST92_08005 [Deltaproteobacteria bacterium]|nr:hypothetical protein [Deltaproteobacteria bacterium]